MKTNKFFSELIRILVIVILLLLLAINDGFLAEASVGEGSGGAVAAAEDPGVIAYVRPSTQDIHLISPDGSGDRVLWNTPRAPGPWGVWDLDWRPDGRELVFSSDHEETCSWFQSDVYAIGFDGGGYRRVTNAPACAGLADLPKGSVTVEVSNWTSSPIWVYVQGAPGIQSVPGDGTLVFDNVADLGPGVLQPAIGIFGLYRITSSPPYADVIPNETVPGGNLIITQGSGLKTFGAGSVSWKADGSALGYGMRSFSGISQIPANPPYGSSGVDLPVVEYAQPGLVAWGPTPATQDQYLYYSELSVWKENVEGIYLNSVGDTSGGTQLYTIIDFDAMHVNDIEWLPDASGFIFSMSYVNFEEYSDIFEYNFATQDITQLTPDLLVDSGIGGAFGFSISPDGQQIVFERAVYPYDTPSSLWMINRDGSNMVKFADDAGTPAWTQTPSLPAPTITSLNPVSAIAGGAAFTLTVNGSDFVSGSVVRWNGSDRPTTYVSSTRLTASIPAAAIATAGSASVTVFNPAPGGGTSNADIFLINEPVLQTLGVYLPLVKR